MKPSKYDRATIIKLVFIAVCLSSAIYVSLAAVNYLNLYPAIGEIQQLMPYQVDNVSLVQSSGTSSLVVYTTVTNPTSYSGLSLAHISFTLYFFSDTNSSDEALNNTYNPLGAYQAVDQPIGPNSALTVRVSFPITIDQTTTLLNFNATHSGQIMASVALRVDLSDFLEPVTGTLIYTRTQDVPLS